MEKMRLKKLAAYEADKARQPIKDFTPGTFGCHECFQMTAFLLNNVTEELCNHPAVIQSEEFFKLASEAESALGKLYSAIKARHNP